MVELPYPVFLLHKVQRRLLLQLLNPIRSEWRLASPLFLILSSHNNELKAKTNALHNIVCIKTDWIHQLLTISKITNKSDRFSYKG